MYYYKVSTLKRNYYNTYSFISFKDRILNKKAILQELNKYIAFWKNKDKQVFIRHFYDKNIITDESRFFIEIKILNKENESQEILRYAIKKIDTKNYKYSPDYYYNDDFIKKILAIE